MNVPKIKRRKEKVQGPVKHQSPLKSQFVLVNVVKGVILRYPTTTV